MLQNSFFFFSKKLKLSNSLWNQIPCVFCRNQKKYSRCVIYSWWMLSLLKSIDIGTENCLFIEHSAQEIDKNTWKAFYTAMQILFIASILRFSSICFKSINRNTGNPESGYRPKTTSVSIAISFCMTSRRYFSIALPWLSENHIALVFPRLSTHYCFPVLSWTSCSPLQQSLSGNRDRGVWISDFITGKIKDSSEVLHLFKNSLVSGTWNIFYWWLAANWAQDIQYFW